MSDGTPFGVWLKQRRKELDLTQMRLAQCAGCAVASIKKLEAGERRPSRQVAELLAQCLDIPAEERAGFVKFARAEPADLDARKPVHTPLPPTDQHAPWRVYAATPARPAVSRTPNNLPPQATLFVGREKEVQALSERLRRPGVRFVTMTGPPGIGKTRLSLQVAAEMLREFEGGVYFVALASISDPRLVVPTIAQVLGIRETPGLPLIDALRNQMRDRRLLLVLDNFEQIVDAAPSVAELMSASPGLKMLVTSRTVLHMYGENELRIPPMAAPGPRNRQQQGTRLAQRLMQYEAVQLFVERAVSMKSDFALTDDNAAAVAEICHRLDGLPLAIELAAARIKFLSPQSILARLESRLKLLTGGAANLPTRQRTLRGAIDWSYDLLDDAERALFRRVSVFIGGFTLQAAEAILDLQVPLAGGFWILASDGKQVQNPKRALERSEGSKIQNPSEGLESLVDKSLLRHEVAQESGGPRFMMLETLREYGLERLTESEEERAMSARHAEYYLDLAEQAELEIQGPQQSAWLDRLEIEHDNLRTALNAFEQQGEVEMALRMSGALLNFWDMRGYVSEGRERIERLLSQAGAGDFGLDSVPKSKIPPQAGPVNPKALSSQAGAVYAKALNAAGRLAMRQGDYAWAQKPLEESLAMSRELGDKQGIAAALNNLGVVALAHGNYALARSLYEESLAIRKELGDKQGVASTLNNLGRLVHGQGDYALARSLYEESLAIRKELGNKYGIALALNNLGEAARSQGDYASARSLYEESLQISRELGDKQGVASTLNNLGHVAYHQGELGRAAALFAEGLELYYELGDKQAIAESLAGVAAVAGAQRKAERAARLFGAAESLREAIGSVFDPADLVDYDRNIADARQQVSELAWESALQEGRAMTLEQAIAHALEDELNGFEPAHG